MISFSFPMLDGFDFTKSGKSSKRNCMKRLAIRLVAPLGNSCSSAKMQNASWYNYFWSWFTVSQRFSWGVPLEEQRIKCTSHVLVTTLLVIHFLHSLNSIWILMYLSLIHHRYPAAHYFPLKEGVLSELHWQNVNLCPDHCQSFRPVVCKTMPFWFSWTQQTCYPNKHVNIL